MADKQQSAAAEPPLEFPPQIFPIVFTDGIISLSHNESIIKMYFGRIDPEIWGRNTNHTQAVAQLVMPVDAFVASFVFLEQRIEALRNANVITQERIDKARVQLLAPGSAPT